MCSVTLEPRLKIIPDVDGSFVAPADAKPLLAAFGQNLIPLPSSNSFSFYLGRPESGVDSV